MRARHHAPAPGSLGGYRGQQRDIYRGQQRDIQAGSAHARLPGIVAPAEDQLVFLNRHDDRFHQPSSWLS